MKIEILPDQNSIARRAAKLFIDLANESQHVDAAGAIRVESSRTATPFSVALSGGTTPKMLYKILTSEPWKDRLPWEKIQWFVGDERNVPLDHKDSNFRMAEKELFEPAGVPKSQQFPIERIGIAPPEQVASDYETTVLQQISDRADNGAPQFDLIFLGVGTDGHTASLFPHTNALDPPQGKAVVANYVDKLQTWRITVTPDVIRAAKHVIVLVTGEDKAQALSHVLDGQDDFFKYPAQVARDLPGATWLIDKPASAMLKDR